MNVYVLLRFVSLLLGIEFCGVIGVRALITRYVHHVLLSFDLLSFIKEIAARL